LQALFYFHKKLLNQQRNIDREILIERDIERKKILVKRNIKRDGDISEDKSIYFKNNFK